MGALAGLIIFLAHPLAAYAQPAGAPSKAASHPQWAGILRGFSPGDRLALQSRGIDLGEPLVLSLLAAVLDGAPAAGKGGFEAVKAAFNEAAASALARAAEPAEGEERLEISLRLDNLLRFAGLFDGPESLEEVKSAAKAVRSGLRPEGFSAYRQAEGWLRPRAADGTSGAWRPRRNLLARPGTDEEFEAALSKLKSPDAASQEEAVRQGERFEWTGERKRRLRREFFEASDADFRSRLMDMVMSGEDAFANTLESLAWLYPEYRPEIEEAYAAFADGHFNVVTPGSILARPDWVRAWAGNMRRFRGADESGFLKNRKGLLGPDFRPNYFFAFPREAGVAYPGGYRLPYFLDGGGSGAAAAGAGVVSAAYDIPSSESGAGIKARHALFDRLIDANFQALEALSSMALSPTQESAAGLFAQARRMADLFKEFASEDLGAALDSIELKAALDSRAVFELDPGRPFDSLHSLINYMHQKALQAFSRFSMGGKSSASGRFNAGHRSIPFAFVGEGPVSEAIEGNGALMGFLERVAARPLQSLDTLVFDERRVWLHTKLGVHSAEIFADLSDPDDGGMLRIRYMDSGIGSGSRYRLRLTAAFLAGLGIPTSIEGDSRLGAVLDKDHGLSSKKTVAEAFGRVVDFLQDSRDIDLMFQGDLARGAAEEALGEKVEGMAALYLGEGKWPFLRDSSSVVMDHAVEKYFSLDFARRDFRAMLDSELGRLGLAPIPEEAPFGQETIDQFFSRPIAEAAARGEISWERSSRPERAAYTPLEDLAGVDAVEGGRIAGLLDSLEEPLLFEAIGKVGGFSAERAHARLRDGSTLAVHALRDGASGRLAFARASSWTRSGGRRELGARELREMLSMNALSMGEAEEMTPPQREGLLKTLREPVEASGLFHAAGLGASPGREAPASGPLVLDRASPRKGGILAVPFTTPDDLEAISNSRGVVTTGGGALSHAAITTRELGLPSVILPSARVAGGELVLRMTRLGAPRTLPSGIQVAELEDSGEMRLREGDLVSVDGSSGRVFLGKPPSARPKAALPVEKKAASPAEKLPAEFLGREPLLFRLDEIDARFAELAGGKSAKLGEMSQALRGTGAFVPGGVALTHFAYERFLAENGFQDKIAALAREIDALWAKPEWRLGSWLRRAWLWCSEAGRMRKAEELSRRIRETILSGRLDPRSGVGKEIARALPEVGSWAVRSSAIQEDGDDAAFAGAAESYLFVKPGEVLEKIVENWASFWLPRGIAYRKDRGLLSADLKPATLVQAMSEAEVSGVIFTRNPVDSADEVVINSSWGLGEGVVSGRASADVFATRKSDGEEIRLPHVADKPLRVESAEGGGTRIGRVPRALRKARTLTRAQTRELTAVAAAMERRFGRPLDIEFSIHEGRIVVLQARPITTLNYQPANS